MKSTMPSWQCIAISWLMGATILQSAFAEEDQAKQSALLADRSNLFDMKLAQALNQSTAASETRGSMFEVSAADAERALERTLTRSGALLLPAGQAEVQLGATYSHSAQQAPVLLQQDTQFGIGTIETRRNEWNTNLTARVGLPHDMQLELNFPYRFVSQKVVEPLTFSTAKETSQSASSPGDLTIGIAKTLFREQGSRPDLIARIAYNTGSGQQSRDSVSIGDGFKKIRTELTVLKRQDPIVFTGNLSYETTFKKDGLQPGDQLGLSIAALLAASPDTSLSIGIDQGWVKRTRINGAAIAGSDQVSSALVFGSTSMIGKRTLLSVSVGAGLTNSTPDYFLNVALPIRFELFK